ncbi:hypothetical protein WKH75_11970 [Acinetobacter baumannii]
MFTDSRKDYIPCVVKSLKITTIYLNEAEFQKVFGSILLYNKRNTTYRDSDINGNTYHRNLMEAEFSFENVIDYEPNYFEKLEKIIRDRLKESFNSDFIKFEYYYRD